LSGYADFTDATLWLAKIVDVKYHKT